VRSPSGYGAVWAERSVRRLLVASLAGRVAFSMLPLGVVVFATEATGSTAAPGALVAAFLLTSTLAPVRGRIVDRCGPPALVAFAAACAAGLLGLWLAGVAGAPVGVLLVLGALTGAAVPPLGPFTRAVWGAALRGRGERLQRVYALDSAGEEAALIVAPLLVAAITWKWCHDLRAADARHRAAELERPQRHEPPAEPPRPSPLRERMKGAAGAAEGAAVLGALAVAGRWLRGKGGGTDRAGSGPKTAR
jgi:MFS family permease